MCYRKLSGERALNNFSIWLNTWWWILFKLLILCFILFVSLQEEVSTNKRQMSSIKRLFVGFWHDGNNKLRVAHFTQPVKICFYYRADDFSVLNLFAFSHLPKMSEKLHTLYECWLILLSGNTFGSSNNKSAHFHIFPCNKSDVNCYSKPKITPWKLLQKQLREILLHNHALFIVLTMLIFHFSVLSEEGVGCWAVMAKQRNRSERRTRLRVVGWWWLEWGRKSQKIVFVFNNNIHSEFNYFCVWNLNQFVERAIFWLCNLIFSAQVRALRSRKSLRTLPLLRHQSLTMRNVPGLLFLVHSWQDWR